MWFSFSLFLYNLQYFLLFDQSLDQRNVTHPLLTVIYSQICFTGSSCLATSWFISNLQLQLWWKSNPQIYYRHRSTKQRKAESNHKHSGCFTYKLLCLTTKLPAPIVVTKQGLPVLAFCDVVIRFSNQSSTLYSSQTFYNSISLNHQCTLNFLSRIHRLLNDLLRSKKNVFCTPPPWH